MENRAFRLIFVAGAMRSGTTLLQRVLCTSPAANPFIHGCRYLVGQLAIYANYAGVDRLYIDNYFGSQDEFFSFTKDLLDRLLQATHQRSRYPETLILKSPELSTYFPYAAALFPDAMFVISVRNPKDTIASMIRVGENHRQNGINSFLSNAGRNLEVLCNSYRKFYLPVIQTINKNRERIDRRVHFVRYEDLISNTDQTVSQLSDFSGLSLQASAVGDEAKSRDQGPRKRDPILNHPRWSAYVTNLNGGPISDASIGRYQNVLEPEEARIIDQLCSDIQEALGKRI